MNVVKKSNSGIEVWEGSYFGFHKIIKLIQKKVGSMKSHTCCRIWGLDTTLLKKKQELERAISGLRTHRHCPRAHIYQFFSVTLFLVEKEKEKNKHNNCTIVR